MHLQLSALGDCCCLLQEGIYNAFEEAVTKKVGEFKQGGGLDPSTTLGPLIGHSAVDRVRPGHSQPESPEELSMYGRVLHALAVRQG